MEKYKELIETIRKSAMLSNEDAALCKQYFEPMTVAKNTILDEEGKVSPYLYFVNSGYMRLFYYDQNGDEQTNLLASSGHFVASFLCFIHQTKATENVECVTDCDLLRIRNSDMKKLIDESEYFKIFSLTIFEQAIAATASRANDLATLNAEQRYKKLIEQQPELLQNIPIQYIASYLGIKPQSLSRIRKNIFK